VIRRTTAQLAAMCGAEMNEAAARRADDRICGVATDSRRPAEGRLFVPLSGERFDAHDYVGDAFAGGAAASLWQAGRPVPEALAGRPLLLVDDTLAALQRLAAAYRGQLSATVIGITGSNGKTTTKDMMASVLARRLRVHKTEGNLNNHIGLPLSILAMDENTEAAVLEMGMSGFGEIERLTRIARPDVAVITNIGDAHLLQLGSREGIARAKLEIAAGLKEGGVLLINGDEPLLREGAKRAEGYGKWRLETFALGREDGWSAKLLAATAKESAFTIRPPEGPEWPGEFRVPVPGRHNVANALAAAAVGALLGLDPESIRQGLGAVKLSAMRLETTHAANGAVVLNDTYNASPASVKAMIAFVGELTGYRRKWLVLGDMLELGPDENRLHYETGAAANPDRIHAVLAVGERSKHTVRGAAERLGPERAIHFADKDALVRRLLAELAPDDLVLVKGSRGMRMEEVVHALVRG